MKLRMNEIIRSHRKAMNLTQEQLAEAVGVTVGAVSKWESGLSSPDIAMLPVLADFFEISVDVLLGYQLNCRTATSASEKIHNLCLLKNYKEGMQEAEKALQRFPNYFEVVYKSAELYHIHGVEEQSSTSLKKALTLYNKACDLISQNTDPVINELQLQSSIGQVYVSLGEVDHAIEHLKKYNSCGINNGMIGFLMAQTDQYKEAMPYLSDSLLESLLGLFRTTMGLANCYKHKGEPAAAIEVQIWMCSILKGLQYSGRTSYLDKTLVILLTDCAQAAASMNDSEQTENYLREAISIAKEFDASMDHSTGNIKFYEGKDMSLGDDFGETALKGIEHYLKANPSDNSMLTTIFRRLNNE